jgi:hypothetical protein
MEATGNPLSLGGRAEDVGPNLEPTGKKWVGGMHDDWMAERDSFEAYLAARGMGGLSDTAGARMQRKQVREMENRLAGEGEDGRAILEKVLRDPANTGIIEAWREEEDTDYGCPGALALLPNLLCLTLLLGLLLTACFSAAYQSTPQISDEELEKTAIRVYREKMAAGQRDMDGMEPEPEPEPEEAAEPHTDAYIFLAASIGFFLLGVVALATSEGGDDEPPAVAIGSTAASAQQRGLPPPQVAVHQPSLPAQTEQELERQKLDLLFAKKVGSPQPQPQDVQREQQPPPQPVPPSSAVHMLRERQQQPQRQQQQPPPPPSSAVQMLRERQQQAQPQPHPQPQPQPAPMYDDEEEDFC